MNWTRVLPVAMIVESIAASVVYFVKGDVRHGLYWAFAAALTATVTF